MAPEERHDENNDTGWISRAGGRDGGGGDSVNSTRLAGRSVWNDRWLLVIPASSLSSDRTTAIKTFIEGLDSDKDGEVDIPGVSDIELGFRAYSRSGN